MSLQLLLRVVRHFNFSRAHILDFHRRRAIHVEVVAVATHRAADMKLVFHQFAVGERERHRTLGVGDGRRVATPAPTK